MLMVIIDRARQEARYSGAGRGLVLKHSFLGLVTEELPPHNARRIEAGEIGTQTMTRGSVYQLARRWEMVGAPDRAGALA